MNESGESLENIVTSVIKIGDIVAEIAAASQEQASVSMNQHAREMVSLVDFFKVDNLAPVMKVVEKPAASVSKLETTATKSPTSGQQVAPAKIIQDASN